jgi:hypothetical protein
MRERNADSYHQVSTPQFDWGLVLLDRLSLEGHELAFDIGSGTLTPDAAREWSQLLEETGRGDEAVDHYCEPLRMNRNDNQSVRDTC